MQNIIYSKGRRQDALELIAAKKMFGVDKDGVIVDPSELIYMNRRKGYEWYGMEFTYDSRTNYALGGVSARYNGGIMPILALLAFDRMYSQLDTEVRNDKVMDILNDVDAEAKLDSIIARHTDARDVDLAKDIYSWDNGSFFNSAEAAQYVRPLPGAKDALMGLAELYQGRIAILTNTHARDTVLRDLSAGGFSRAELSSFTIVCDAKKPNPESFDRTMQKFSVDRQDAGYIGDAAIDITMAARAGVTAVGVLSGMGSLKDLVRSGADVVAKDLQGLYTSIRR